MQLLETQRTKTVSVELSYSKLQGYISEVPAYTAIWSQTVDFNGYGVVPTQSKDGKFSYLLYEPDGKFWDEGREEFDTLDAALKVGKASAKALDISLHFMGMASYFYDKYLKNQDALKPALLSDQLRSLDRQVFAYYGSDLTK